MDAANTDILTLFSLSIGLTNDIPLQLKNTALLNKASSKGVKISPTKILYGDEYCDPIGSTDEWKEALMFILLSFHFGTLCTILVIFQFFVSDLIIFSSTNLDITTVHQSY